MHRSLGSSCRKTRGEETATQSRCPPCTFPPSAEGNQRRKNYLFPNILRKIERKILHLFTVFLENKTKTKPRHQAPNCILQTKDKLTMLISQIRNA